MCLMLHDRLSASCISLAPVAIQYKLSSIGAIVQEAYTADCVNQHCCMGRQCSTGNMQNQRNPGLPHFMFIISLNVYIA